jgi:hypothetical protein
MLSWEPIPKAYSGQTVFVIGGGPSAEPTPWERLIDKATLGCNAAAFVLPKGCCKWALFGDRPFFRAFRHLLKQYVDWGGRLINATGRPIDQDNTWMLHVNRSNSRKNWGISVDPSTIRWNRSTGGCAINVAYLLGAREIVLIGFDMKAIEEKKQHNWHNAYDKHYEKGSNNGGIVKPGLKQYQLNMIHAFPVIANELERLGVKCWNTYADSNIKDFPYRPLEEFL